MSEETEPEALEYLRRYPDVAQAVARGRFVSARGHFEQHGKYEGRIWPTIQPAEAPPFEGSCDVAILAGDRVFLQAWVDDRVMPAAGIGVVDMGSGARTEMLAQRHRRQDVDQHLQALNPAEFGLWAFGALPPGARSETLAFAVTYANGAAAPVTPGRVLRFSTQDMFEHFLGFYGKRETLGNITARSFAELDGPLGPLVTEMYGRLRASRRVTLRAEFGAGAARPKLSLICVLYGIPDFLYLLVARFAQCARLDEMEFIFVSNSPELEEVLARDAELAAFVFGTTVRLIGLNQNCGFSHANNVGIAEAASDSIVVINPDVFPRSAAAVTRLVALASRPGEQRITGGKLYYADGSVMHDGMFFDPDRKLSALCGVPVWTVEHFRKGFADRGGDAVRAVPAVTGALMVFDRRFGQELGLFDEDFLYGHYEDADLCLRARAAGGEVVLDPALAFWHYEGRGSVKRPEHKGSGLVNRWLFSNRWGTRLEGANDV